MTLTYEFHTKSTWLSCRRTAALAIPIGKTERVSLRSAVRSRWQAYLNERYDDWYTYAYVAHRSGLLKLPRSLSGGVEAVFQAHESSGEAALDRSAQAKLNALGFRLILVQGTLKAPTWVTAVVRGSGSFVATIKVPRPNGNAGALRRQSSRGRRSQIETRFQSSSDSISMKWYSGPIPQYEEDSESSSHEVKSDNEKASLDWKGTLTMVPTECLFIEPVPLSKRASYMSRWRTRIPFRS